MSNAIEIKNLNFSYNSLDLTLKNINFSYNMQDFLAIIGPNGGGKSTFFKILLGILKPKNAQISIFGKSVNEARSLIGYVPQIVEVNKNFPISALEVVLMGRIDKKKFGFYSKEDIAQAMEKLELVKMSEFANRRIGDLSGGQRQRVYIARALICKSKILLLDEPTASIDPIGQSEIYSLLKQINRDGIGVIMISHDINMALNYVDKIAYINKELFIHDIPREKNAHFLEHLMSEHNHFCQVELALGACGC